jgi:hypothetical protein
MDPNVCNIWLKSDYISRQAIHTMAKEAIHTMAKGAIHTMAKGKRTNSCDPDG